MKLKQTFPALFISLTLMVVAENKAAAQTENNPFLTEYKTPFQVPPFDEIKETHYLPAFQKGMALQLKRIEQIANTPEAPTFENTIVALENSGQELDKVSTVFYNLTSANTSPALEEIARKVSPLMAKHSDDIYFNGQLYQRVKAVFEQQADLDLNPEQRKLIEKTYKAFVRNGAQLNAKEQEKMRAINKELAFNTLKFGQNVLAETNSFELIVNKETDLKGLPASLKSAAATSAKEAGKEGSWRFTLHNASVMPFLQYADNRNLRKQMYQGYTSRGNHNNDQDNKKTIQEIVRLRAERAQLLGYKNHASFILEENMISTPEEVLSLLDKVWKPALQVAKKEKAEMEEMMNAEGIKGELEAWDWFYYADKVKKKKYDFDAELLRPYFQLEKVKEGIFTLARKLYGLEFNAIDHFPKYHEDVQAYEVLFEDGEFASVLYMDFHSRNSKRGGAWMTSYRKQAKQDEKRIAPVISMVCNFSSATEETPALLTPSEVTTFFHEFGHALHGLLSNVEYRSLSGTSVSRDFVELPSQIMENWSFEPEMLSLYAQHYQTGETIPMELIEKLDNASKFNQGFITVEYLAASYLDMAYHTLSNVKKMDIEKFEQKEMNRIGLIKQIASRYKSTYFQHIFAGGYSSGYYSYIWSEILDKDAFAVYKESGDLFNQEVANRFRKYILEKGGTEDPKVMYHNFRGQEPEVKHLLKSRGLEDPS